MKSLFLKQRWSVILTFFMYCITIFLHLYVNYISKITILQKQNKFSENLPVCFQTNFKIASILIYHLISILLDIHIFILKIDLSNYF